MKEDAKIYKIEIGGKEVSFETGRLCEQANGSCLVRCGETVVMVNVTMSKEPRPGIDFFPLAVDFEEAAFKGNYFLFPSRIYGKERILETRKDRKGGTSLEKYYDDNGQCLLLGYNSTLYDRQELYKISRFANKKLLVVPMFGHTTTYSVDLSNCKNDIYYSIEILSDGQIVVREI